MWLTCDDPNAEAAGRAVGAGEQGERRAHLDEGCDEEAAGGSRSRGGGGGGGYNGDGGRGASKWMGGRGGYRHEGAKRSIVA